MTHETHATIEQKGNRTMTDNAIQSAIESEVQRRVEAELAKRAPVATDAKLVIVRTYSAGVHIGELVSRNGQEATIANSRRLWRWRGANTLNEAALYGVAQEFTRISEPVPSIDLTQVIEVIPVASAAVKNLTTSRWAP